MALTPEQKQANKEARRIRDRAHRERCDAREAAKKDGLGDIADSEIMLRLHAAQTEEKELMRDRDYELAGLDREIARLKARRETIAAEWHAKWGVVREQVRAAWNEKNAAEAALEQRLDERFPDLIGDARWSAPIWDERRKALSA